MKKLRWKAILKSMGYSRNKSGKYWASEEHIAMYSKNCTGQQILDRVLELEYPPCWGCGGDGLNTNNDTCIVCKGKGWTDEY